MSKKQLTTFDKVKSIRLLTRVGESLSYKNWGDDYKLKNIQDVHKALKRWEETNGSFKINPTQLTVKEMEELGFGSWEEGRPMKLIPIWLFPFLCDEFESESISGSKHTKLSEIDSDHRFGSIAFGVVSKL